jgi:MFS transporter, ACS family, tartrate transporter
MRETVLPSDDTIYRKISVRIIPFMMALYLVAFLDRVNIGFAALTMNADLGLSPSAYGWAAGIFFIGYLTFEVPGNLILERIGARFWIAGIAMVWGLVSIATGFVHGNMSLCIVRFLLGVAEAGFLPGMILYLTYWFPAERLARFVGLFMMAVPLASAIGAPMSGLILDGMDGLLGVKGWQWLFIIEGVPSCILGLMTLVVLPDRPARVRWLTTEERAIVVARAAGTAANRPSTHEKLWPALLDRRVLLLGLVYFGVVVGLYGIGLWLPQLIRGLGFSITQVGLATALPYVVSSIAMLLWAVHSDRTGERAWHVALPIAVSAASLLASIYFPSSTFTYAALCLATVGIYATLGPFWVVPPLFLAGTGAAGGIALINSIGNLGGFLGPLIVGWTSEITNSYQTGLAVLTIFFAIAALAALQVRREMRGAESELTADSHT